MLFIFKKRDTKRNVTLLKGKRCHYLLAAKKPRRKVQFVVTDLAKIIFRKIMKEDSDSFQMSMRRIIRFKEYLLKVCLTWSRS